MKKDKVGEATQAAETYLVERRGLVVEQWWSTLPKGVDHALVQKTLALAVSAPDGASPAAAFARRVVANGLARRKYDASYLDDLVSVLEAHPEWPEGHSAKCLPEGTPTERAEALKLVCSQLEMLGVNDANKRKTRAKENAGDAVLRATLSVVLERCDLSRFEPVFRHGYVLTLMLDGSDASVDTLAALAQRALKDQPSLVPMLSRTLDPEHPRLATLVAELRTKAATQT